MRDAASNVVLLSIFVSSVAKFPRLVTDMAHHSNHLQAQLGASLIFCHNRQRCRSAFEQRLFARPQPNRPIRSRPPNRQFFSLKPASIVGAKLKLPDPAFTVGASSSLHVRSQPL